MQSFEPMGDDAGDLEPAGVRANVNGGKCQHGAEDSRGGVCLFGQDTRARRDENEEENRAEKRPAFVAAREWPKIISRRRELSFVSPHYPL
jgi:hypothetical protein